MQKGMIIPAKKLSKKQIEEYTITIQLTPKKKKESDLLSYISNEYKNDKRSKPMNPVQLKKHLDELKKNWWK